MKNTIDIIDITDLDDFSGTLSELRMEIDKLIEKYSENSIISFDAGYNNISCRIFIK